MPDYVSEWYRTASHPPYDVTRRQIVEVPGGYQLTPVELVGKGPECLRDYDGGWQFPSKVRVKLVDIERHLTDNGYTREMPKPGAPPVVRRRSGPSGQNTGTKRTIRVASAVWDAAGAKCARLGTDRNAVIGELLSEWVTK